MRIPRFSILTQPAGMVHLYWRCHNKEHLLSKVGALTLYFESLIFGLLHRRTAGAVKLHAFCFMGNHAHQQMSYQGGAEKLSAFMRVAHSKFGAAFNRAFNRSGKVANERPKTPLIQDSTSQMRVHMYIEANPIRAGITTREKLRYYKGSSYRFYAYGEVDEFTKHLIPPQWYLDLGDTPEERQRAYRKLFETYLDETKSDFSQFLKLFIGSPQWTLEQRAALRSLLTRKKAKSPSCPDRGANPPLAPT